MGKSCIYGVGNIQISVFSSSSYYIRKKNFRVFYGSIQIFKLFVLALLEKCLCCLIGDCIESVNCLG